MTQNSSKISTYSRARRRKIAGVLLVLRYSTKRERGRREKFSVALEREKRWREL